MSEKKGGAAPKASTLRWTILRRALLPRSHITDKHNSEIGIERVSRKTSHGFSLIPSCLIENRNDTSSSSSLIDSKEAACFCYTLPVPNAPKLFLFQRFSSFDVLGDFEICNRYDIDNTGLVYIQHNIDANSGAFGPSKVKSLMLHWNKEEISDISNKFDIVVASDCTFFTEFHKGLVQTLVNLLKSEGPSTAIFFSPKRGDTFDKFVAEVKEIGLHYSIDEIYDTEIWRQHQDFVRGDDSWPNYDKDHCYPFSDPFGWYNAPREERKGRSRGRLLACLEFATFALPDLLK
uniref:Calmodulin-lysine N-methyltransferase n=1 Tax=Daucus carota subsp. sativus TaxID=79200 RepID=A0A164W0Z9_DAUCS